MIRANVAVTSKRLSFAKTEASTMTVTKDLRPQANDRKKPSKHDRVNMEVKLLQDAGIAPDETHSQDSDRRNKVTHQKFR
jgi:hypothetical protein